LTAVGTERPQGTVTFLFTDIEGSTELVRKLGSDYAGLLGDHRQLLREAFSAHGGWEVDTQGDAFFVAFDRAKDAVLAAVAAQRAVTAHDWPSEPPPKIRIGLHTSEPHLWPEGYVGIGVHRASRICNVGHGGQVLLSRSTAGLAADQELEAIDLLDLGEHRLKGLERPERIFQLVIEGLDNDFPPLDTMEGAGIGTETVTVLMTDLENLGRRARDLAPDQFRSLIADYHRTFGRVLSETGGRAMISFADTAVAVYRSARQAALAAAELQRTTSGHAWPGDVRIRVAIALDSGEVIATGYGPIGLAVNRCERLLERASGGQILLAEATRNLLTGHDLGNLELRPWKGGLMTPEEGLLKPGGVWHADMPIYELIIPGLPADYHRLRRDAPSGAA
jgi:class 3 adenylate cyclase